MLKPVLQYLQTTAEARVKRLCDLLRIKSISTDPAYVDQVQEAAQWVYQRLHDTGLQTTLHTTERHPIIMASNADDPRLSKDVPHILLYGHYDVQPPDPMELWDTPPFEPTIRQGAVYARGASDDKGQICCMLEALVAWKQIHGSIPIRVTVLIEGEEECGSGSLRQFIEQHPDQLQADVAIISDTTMWDADTVAITYGLRGLLYYDLKLHGPSRDLHSGMYGGVLANPCNELTSVLGKLFDDQHRITIPGFYDDVLDLTDTEREQWEKLNFDPIEHCFKPVGVSQPHGEMGFTTLQRKWARPACDINGLYGGYGGEGAKTVIPSFAGAKVSFRLAPNQNPQTIANAFEQWLDSHDVHGCRWERTHLGDAVPVVVSQDSPFMAAASKAIENATGKPPVLVREGASIPVVGQFKQDLGIDSLLIGFGLVSDAIHSPNEKFDLDCFHLGCRTHAALIGQLAEMGCS